VLSLRVKKALLRGVSGLTWVVTCRRLLHVNDVRHEDAHVVVVEEQLFLVCRLTFAAEARSETTTLVHGTVFQFFEHLSLSVIIPAAVYMLGEFSLGRPVVMLDLLDQLTLRRAVVVRRRQHLVDLVLLLIRQVHILVSVYFGFTIDIVDVIATCSLRGLHKL
jgi:hypothetical protein